jgi:Zn-dependent protease
MVRPANFFRQQLQIATIGGIPVRVDYGWFPVFALFTIAAAAALRTVVEDFVSAVLLGFAVTLAFFFSVLVHELSHSAAAIRESLSVVEVVLHPFGGFTRFKHPPETPASELRIAAAGPLASILLSLLFAIGGWATLMAGMSLLSFFLLTTAAANLLLGFFNLLPGYPLDGGRLLRAYLWKQGRNLREATAITGRLGKFIGAAIFFVGLFIGIFSGQWLAGVWSAGIGIFLFDSARAILAEIQKESNLTVADRMQLSKAIPADLNIQKLADEILPMFPQSAFPVIEGGRFAGLLILEDIRRIDRSKWHQTTVRAVMRPAASDLTIWPDAPLTAAREKMRSRSIPALAVIDENGSVIGILDERHLPAASRG